MLLPLLEIESQRPSKLRFDHRLITLSKLSLCFYFLATTTFVAALCSNSATVTKCHKIMHSNVEWCTLTLCLTADYNGVTLTCCRHLQCGHDGLQHDPDPVDLLRLGVVGRVHGVLGRQARHSLLPLRPRGDVRAVLAPRQEVPPLQAVCAVASRH